MKNKIQNISLLVVIAFMAISCAKEGCKDPSALNYDPDAKKDDGSCLYAQPELTITSPGEGTTFMHGQVVEIQATATAPESMHGYSLYLVNTSTAEPDTVMQMDEHEHGTTINISEEWTNDVTMHSDMELTIKVEVDHDATELVETVHFHCHPMSMSHGEVSFHMHFISDGEEVVMGEEQSLNGMEVTFNRIQFYIHDVTFYADQGMSESFQLENTYWLAGLGNTHFEAGEVELSHLHAMTMNIGVDPVANSQSESEFLARPADDPLSAQTPPMHWSWNAGSGYKFAVYEGTFNGGANEFVYHCATDDMLRESDPISLDLVLDHENMNEIHLMVDLSQVFSGIDISTTNTAHGAQPANALLMDNIAGAMSVME